MMLKINETFKVRSIFTCDLVQEYLDLYEHDPIWRQSTVGCLLINILQDMYGFNLSYALVDYIPGSYQQDIYPSTNHSIDIYGRPLELKINLLDYAYPVQSIFNWRFGFLMRRKFHDISTEFYTQPFTTAVWVSILSMILLGSIVFYILSDWDTRIYSGECSYMYELLLAFSAYCQHILPLQGRSSSRRIAYLTFIMCAYVVHCFYTSNLLSHLVSDGDESMDLETLAESEYKIALLEDMRIDTDKRKYEKSMDKNLSIVWKKILRLKVMNLSSALDAMINQNTALITDYVTLYPILKKYLDGDIICQLMEVDIYSNVKQYLFTSKNFSYKEEFKIGTLRAKEGGLMRRVLAIDKYSPIKCDTQMPHYISYIDQTFFPISVLATSYVLALLILIAEKIHFKRYRVWPYTE